ncbi:MAG: NADH-quinone oxidoreductase subunit A [Chitinophagaceae bacterium]
MNTLTTLLDTTPIGSTSSGYLPIIMQILFAAGFVGSTLLISNFLGPKRRSKKKLEPFASGIASHGDARQPLAIKYFLVAILFVLFDVEVIFFYPYAVNFRWLGWSGFREILLFVALFLVGFFYIVKKKALIWEE